MLFRRQQQRRRRRGMVRLPRSVHHLLLLLLVLVLLLSSRIVDGRVHGEGGGGEGRRRRRRQLWSKRIGEDQKRGTMTKTTTKTTKTTTRTKKGKKKGGDKDKDKDMDMEGSPSPFDLIEECYVSEEAERIVNLANEMDRKQQEVGRRMIPFPLDEPEGFFPDPVINDDLTRYGIADLTIERFEWLSNMIPSSFDGTNGETFDGLPPASFSNQLAPFFNFVPGITSFGYKKWGSIPFAQAAFNNIDPATWKPSDARNTLFTMNLEERGEDNLLKKKYLFALTCDKMPLYQKKIDNTIKNFARKIENGAVPVLSTFFEDLLSFFLDIHIGQTTEEVPSYVSDYFRDFASIVSDPNGPRVGLENDLVKTNLCRRNLVDRYFEQRRDVVVMEEDRSTLLYWWDRADFPVSGFIFEGIHNIIAFNQFANMLFTLIRARTPFQPVADDEDDDIDPLAGGGIASFRGTGGGVLPFDDFESLLYDRPPERTIDFFAKLMAAETEDDKVNVVREAFRMLMPNFIWFSSTKQTQQSEDAKADLNEAFPWTYFLPFLIQGMNDGYNATRPYSTKAGQYDTSRYDNFRACPYLSSKSNDDDDDDDEDGGGDGDGGGDRHHHHEDIVTEFNASDFVRSSTDGIEFKEATIVPKTHEDFFPIFPPPGKGDDDDDEDDDDGLLNGGAKYCPFGLGYRRCPGEILSMTFVQRLMEELAHLDFIMDPPSNLFEPIYRNNPAWDDAVPITTIGRRRDNLFVRPKDHR